MANTAIKPTMESHPFLILYFIMIKLNSVENDRKRPTVRMQIVTKGKLVQFRFYKTIHFQSLSCFEKQTPRQIVLVINFYKRKGGATDTS